MDLPSAFDLQRWVDEHQHLFSPPRKTNHVIAAHADLVVMILHGPNVRLDFHIDPGDEFFYQIRGAIELHVKAAGERRRVVRIGEGEMFVCPAGLAHSPRRGADTWGLVIERRRRAEESEGFRLFCERCDMQVYAQELSQSDLADQIAHLNRTLNGDRNLRTCAACGYVFPEAPQAERLGFLNA
jgi:3-hydroxyanthranilate 3,4-dioxygenase